jgi:YYY domain-containing protein
LKQDRSRRTNRLARAYAPIIILVGILLIAGYLRFTGLNWDEGQYIHPDEGHMRNTVSLIRWPDDLSVYFDTHQSPLNVRNNQGRRYSYGTLPLFAARAAGEWLDSSCTDSPALLSRTAARLLVGASRVEGCRPGTFTGIYNAVVGRTLSALADLGTLILVFLMGRRLYGEAAGLVAAGFGAVTAFMIQQAHFFTVDSMAAFFVTFVAFFSVRAAQGRRTGNGPDVRWLDFALAGLGVGLATACKVSGATAALLVVLAGVQTVMRERQERAGTYGASGVGSLLSSTWVPLLALCLAGALSLVAFRVAQPYAFEGPGFFGVEPSPEWFGRLQQIRAEQSGEVDLPSGRQWTNRAPVLFAWVNIVVWGMGIPLGLAGWVGWGIAGYQLFTGRGGGRKHLVLWGWLTVMFVYQSTRWVKSMRYFLPLYPILLLFAAAWLVHLARARAAWVRRSGLAISAAVGLGALFWGVAVFTIYVRPHPRVAASRWIYENVPEGATVANEHWDWGLPLRLDGRDPFGGSYTGIEMQHYNEDILEKRQQLYRWLEEADWVFLASNRLYASIPRLPSRYPLTTEYYRALFAGELGFELEADFASYPALGPFVFPDQENPFELMEPDYVSQNRPVEVPLPPAEEAFSVYDHPRVLIFRKTEAYSEEKVRRILGAVELDRVQHGRTPREATEAPDMLRFEAETWAAQQGGGTWSEMFDRDGLVNQYPGLAALVWWAAVALLGWLAFPLLFAALPGLRDRGYGFARVLGLLLIAYLTWLAGSLRLFPNTRATIARMVAFLAVVGGGVAWLRRNDLKRFLRDRWRALVAVEGLFALLFVVWIGVRMLQPDLWHPIVGGEKPMDFAYLNAVMKSTWFPPYNPWLSGTWINYYYFGFVLVGTLTKLLGTVPSIAYNLAVPLLFALTGAGAFSVAYNLLSDERRRRGRHGALVAGLAAPVFVVLMGNLGVIHLLRNKLMAIGDVSFPSTIPGFPSTLSLLRGIWRVVIEGAEIGMRHETWYWHPTRIIPAEAGNPIAEFPAFTFLYGDLHAHMIAFPLTLFAVVLAVNWVRASRPSWGSLLIGGLVVGALRPTNTWDYPTYLLLGVAALGLGAWRASAASLKPASEERAGRARRRLGAFLRRTAWSIPLFVALSIWLYLPYSQHYVAGYNSLHLWDGGRTPIGIYLWIYAALLFPVVTRMIVGAVDLVRHRQADEILLGSSAAGAVMLGAGLWQLGVPVALVAVPILILGSVLFFLTSRAEGEEREGEGLFWLLVVGAMGLSLAVEVVVLEGDIGRMNTVFKFYLQVWILLSIAAAVSLAWIWRRSRTWDTAWLRGWGVVMGVLMVGGLLFLPFGIRARAADRMAPGTGLTLDGMAFVERAVIHDGPEDDMEEIALAGDYHGIRWLQKNVEGSPVIVEGLGRREYLWANRVSVYTGLPAVVGWRWHEVQQRAGVGGELVNWRRSDVNLLYQTRDIAVAEEILERYDVRYVYVGGYERAYYHPAGLKKFEWMTEQGLLTRAYDASGVTIYEVAW